MAKHRAGQDSIGHGSVDGKITRRLPNSDDSSLSPPRSGEPVKDPKDSKRLTKPGEEIGWSFTGRKKK